MTMPNIILNCQLCGSEFSVERYREFKAKYCGWTCKQTAGAQASALVNIERYRGTGTVGYIKERGVHQHRVVAARTLGRPLKRGEIVHHIDGNKHNNSPENLQVMTQSRHMKLHRPDMVRPKKFRGCITPGCSGGHCAKGLCRKCYMNIYNKAYAAP
ncbi:MAG: HNH endonuclease [Verrucomicrobiaceae bacterium]|nr:MAG: HNH endonuclease [Verrucomicrobiaceae bacterium]